MSFCVGLLTNKFGEDLELWSCLEAEQFSTLFQLHFFGYYKMIVVHQILFLQPNLHSLTMDIHNFIGILV